MVATTYVVITTCGNNNKCGNSGSNVDFNEQESGNNYLTIEVTT